MPRDTRSGLTQASFRSIRRATASLVLAGLAVACSGGSARAIFINGYSAAVNDRFASGFSSAPVNNTDPAFVGLAYDWSGVGWATNDPSKGFGLVSPRHYLVATHYGGAANIRLFTAAGGLITGTQQGVAQTGFGLQNAPALPNPDLSLGTLTTALVDFPQVARYPVLDLNASSTTNSPAQYAGRLLLVYGRGDPGTLSPRIASSSIESASSTLYEDPNNGYMISKTTNYTLQVGDSGSPAFIPWTNPDGGAELTIIGNNAAVDVSGSNNLQNFIGRADVMGQLNTMMNPDGFALRVTGTVARQWEGGAPANPTNLAFAQNWSGNQLPSDVFVLFDGTSTSVRSLNVNANTNLRGLFFKSTASGTLGFTFGGASTVTVGRGGIVNYDTSRQVFTAPLAMNASQYWDVGPGGVTVGTIATNGFLLEIAGSGTALLTGVVSGTGGVALSGHRLEMTGSSSYTGGTWVHGGTLALSGTLGGTAGVVVGASGTFAGTGRSLVGPISGAGWVEPGASAGILTAPAVNPSAGLDFAFELTGTGAPTWSNAVASVNDVLRLTDLATPFTTSLAAVNAVDVFFGVASFGFNDTFLGGFFTDKSGDFLSSVQSATLNYFVLGDGLGLARFYGGQGYYAVDPSLVTLSTVAVASADFAGGTVSNGQVTQFIVVPEPAAWMLLGIAVPWLLRRRVAA